MLARLSKEDITLIVEMKTSGNTSKHIAEVFGVNTVTINRHLKKNGFSDSGKLLKCKNCNEEFKHQSNGGTTQKFCSHKCRCSYNYKRREIKIERSCEVCNKQFISDNYYEKICSDKCIERKKERSEIVRTKKRLRKRKIRLYNTECKCCGNRIISKYRRSYCNNLCSDRMDSKRRSLRKKKLKKCRNCNVWHRRVGFCCSEHCMKKISVATNRDYSKKRYQIARENGEFDRDITIERLMKRDGERCYLCGDAVLFDLHYLDPKYPTIEHVLAIKNGGTHSWDNVKVACRDCNTRKSTTMVEEFMKGVD